MRTPFPIVVLKPASQFWRTAILKRRNDYQFEQVTNLVTPTIQQSISPSSYSSTAHRALRCVCKYNNCDFCGEEIRIPQKNVTYPLATHVSNWYFFLFLKSGIWNLESEIWNHILLYTSIPL